MVLFTVCKDFIMKNFNDNMRETNSNSQYNLIRDKSSPYLPII